jgi:hypothetical protein
MSLKSELEHVVNTYKSEISLIGEFVDYADKSLSRKQNRKPKTEFTKDQKDELKSVLDAIGKAIEGESNSVNLTISSEVSKIIMQKAVPIKHKSFLSEMSLSYLISHQEAFIKDYLYQILIHRQSLLRSGATMTFLEIKKHSSMKSLIASIAQKEVDSIGHGSIDDAADYIQKKLNIDMTEFPKWEKLREACFRRNIIIHNKGVTNEIYCKKTGYKDRNKHIGTTNKYVLNAIDDVKSMINFLHKCILQKFKLEEPDNSLNNGAP